MIYIKVNNTLSRIISVGIRSRKCLPKPLLVTEGDYTDASPNKTSKTDVPCPKKPLQTSKKIARKRSYAMVSALHHQQW